MDTAIVNFLASKENIEYVWAIGENFDQVKDKLQIEFWEMLVKNIEGRLSRTDYPWEVEDEGKEYIAQHAGVNIVPADEPTGQYLAFSLQQERQGPAGFRLFYSVYWNKEYESNPTLTLPGLVNLRAKFSELGMYTNELTWSLSWQWMDYYTRTKDFCFRLSQLGESYVDEVADLIWTFFEEHRESVEKGNKEILTADEVP